MSNVLQVRDLGKGTILKDISFDMQAGEMVAVMGPSGSGKSTLLYNVSGMDQADEGQVLLGDAEITGMSEDAKAGLRLTQMGFVFQQMNMLANLNILDNILLPSVHADKSRTFQSKQKDKALQLMEQFGIRDLTDRKNTEVSGGQLQRACICRSMMLSPQILFADEPTGALNQSASEEVLKAFLQINESGTTILMVTHDMTIVNKHRKRTIVLEHGHITADLAQGGYAQHE